MSRIRYQFEGPFDSSYSLAVLNREMARAVEALRPGSVALHSREGHGDYTPDLNWLAHDPSTIELWQRSLQAQDSTPEVTLRNLYPPRVAGMRGQWHVMNTYGWEESVFPAGFVDEFNQHLHLVTVMSNYVCKVLIDSGVNVPVVTVGVGVDHILRYPVEPVTLPTDKRFRFLHISSCFPRKGVDILLEAYTSTFSAADDVVLIIKTFPNPHNTVAQQIDEIRQRNPDCPAIHLINEDVGLGQINSLYQQANALVAPSRGEGFGMPMAEAMLWDVPVITTGYGGHTDFCTPENSWLIDYQFAKAETHMGQFDSMWVEPDTLHLAALMRSVYEQSQHEAGREAMRLKTAKARQTIENGWCWHQVAGRLLAAVDQLQATPVAKPFLKEPSDTRIAWVSTWNTRCGIASYSEFLLDYFSVPVSVLANRDSNLAGEDGDNVIRCWETCGGKPSVPKLDQLLDVILTHRYTAVVFQFNFAFFDAVELRKLLTRLHEQGIATYVFFHATQDVLQNGQIVSTLRRLGSILATCRRLLVHGIEDVNRLKRFGFVNNVTLLPHGVIYALDRLTQYQPDPNVFRIATYGFLLPGKGIPELISAFALLQQRLLAETAQGKTYPKVELDLFNALYPGNVSEEERMKCATLIQMSGFATSMRLHTEYRDNGQTLIALAGCQVVIFPYQKTRESASGAVRLGLAAGRPVACTPLGIFGDVGDIVHFLPGISPQAMAEGLFELIDNPALLLATQQRQQQWLQDHAWEVIADKLQKLILSSASPIPTTKTPASAPEEAIS